MKLRSPAFALLLSLSVSGLALADPASDQVAGGQYTARLDQSESRWTLLPLEGTDFEVKATCESRTSIPSGLWLISRNSAGEPELVAPSSTRLPNAHSGHVRLVTCENAGFDGQTLALPEPFLELLASHSGAIHVED